MSRKAIHTKVFAVCLALVFLATTLSVLNINAKAVPYEMITGVGSIPANRVAPAAFVVDGTLYVIGGGPDVSGSTYDTVMKYDLTDKTTTYGATMPGGRWSPDYAMGLDGNMYLFGGWNVGYQSGVQIYNPVNDTWWTRTSPYTFGVGTAVTYTNGSIIIFNGDWQTKTSMYTPTTDTWYTMTPTPSGLAGIRSAVLINDTAILVMGGRAFANPVATCELYNPVTDSWTAAASMPLAAGAGGAVMGNDGYVYYIGGFYGGGWPDTAPERTEIQRYDIAADSWTVVPSTISPAKCMFGIAQDQYGRTFIVGGYNTGGLADIDMMLTNDLVETNNIIITSPGANSVVSDTIAVSAMLSSKIFGVDPMLVEFYVDGGFMENALGSSAIRSWTFMWDTAGLIDGSTHTLMVRAYLDNANITEDSITVVVSAKSVSDKIADLENKISQLQSDLNEMNASASQSLIDLESQIADLQDALDEMNATSSQDLSGLQDQVQALQDQLDALQTTTGTAKDSAASANMFAMIGMLVAIIVLVLVIISMMMSRSKK